MAASRWRPGGWDALSGQFNIKSLSCSDSGCQMGGWFTREVTSPEGFKGLRYRMAGPGAEVLRRLGAIVLMLPGGDIMTALRSGAIDASEWIGPWNGLLLLSRLSRAKRRAGRRHQSRRMG
jgi:TRAP-type mannitol/chloroaromatic compound transport system substrate-binding protein